MACAGRERARGGLLLEGQTLKWSQKPRQANSILVDLFEYSTRARTDSGYMSPKREKFIWGANILKDKGMYLTFWLDRWEF